MDVTIGKLKRNDLKGALAVYKAGANSPDEVHDLMTLQDDPSLLAEAIENLARKDMKDEEKKPPFGAEKTPTEKPEPTSKEAPSKETPAAAPAQSGKAKPTASSGEGGKGTSAPITPGQGVPDVKPHDEPGAKAEPEGDKAQLPKEADKSPAKSKPKGLPSVAVMTKEQAESADKDPMNNPHIQRLATLVQQLAKIVQEHHARLGAMPLPGQAAPSPTSQGAQKMGMPGAKPGMFGAPTTKPGMPGAKPMPGMTQPGMAKPSQPGLAGQGIRPGVTPIAPGAALSLDQIKSLMGIIEAANTGRVPRQAASMLISTGFGLDPKMALSMVSPDAQSALSGDPEAPIPGALESGAEEELSLFGEEPEDGDLNPEEEELEGEEFEEEEEGEPVPEKRKVFEQEGPFEDDEKYDWEDQPRDELGRWASEGGGADAADRKITGAGNTSRGGSANKTKSLKGLRGIAERAGGNTPSRESYIAKAMENLKNTSRTAAGTVDLSASPDKAKAMAIKSGSEAKDKAISNYQGVIERLHDERHRDFKDPQELRSFIEGVAADVNKGIVKEGKLIREHDSDKYPYTKVSELDKYMDRYYQELHQKLDDPEVDPKDLAAWSEHKLDLEGHFFSDGVGKTSKAVSSYIMMRRGHELPNWPKDRAKIFDNARGGLGQWTKFYHSMFEGSEAATEATARAEEHRIKGLANKAHKNGGFTYHPSSGGFPSEGFAVSIHPEHEQKWKGKDALTGDRVRDYVSERRDFFEQNPNAHLGGWYNPEDDTWYLDVSHVTNDKKEAVSLGARYKQKGFYDLKEGNTITEREYGEIAAGERGDSIRTLRLHEGFFRPSDTVTRRDRRGYETNPRGGASSSWASGRLDFDPDQPRDEQGRFSSTGGGGGGGDKSRTSLRVVGNNKPIELPKQTPAATFTHGAKETARKTLPVIEQSNRDPKTDPFAETERSREYKETAEERAEVAKALDIANNLAKDWQSKLEKHGVKIQMGGSLVSDLALPGGEAYDADLKFLYDGPNSKDLIPIIERETGLKFVKTVKMGGGGGMDKEVEAHMIEGFVTKDGVTLEVEGALRDSQNYTGWHQHYKNVLTPEELRVVRARKWELTQTPEGRVSKAYKAYKGQVRDVVQQRTLERGLVRRKDFDEDQPRDESGRWTSGGGGSGGGKESSSTSGSKESSGTTKPKAWKGEAAGKKDTQAAFEIKKNVWRADRVKHHNDYTTHATKGVSKSPAPKVYMTGGGPATGKTVGILKNPDAGIPDRSKAAHINPDDAKEFLPEYKEGKGDPDAATFVHEESSWMAKNATEQALRDGHDVVLDTTGDSGIDKLHAKVEKMRAQGAKFIKADYGTVNVDEAVRRAMKRAEEEGRFVPETVIRATHKDVAKTALDALSRGTFDAMDFWDTSGKTPSKIATYTKSNGLSVLNNDAWEAFKRRGDGHP